jgi:hypothetical protein
MDRLSQRAELAREWLRRRAESGPDRVMASEVLAAIESGDVPPREARGWLAELAAEGEMPARIVLEVL